MIVFVINDGKLKIFWVLDFCLDKTRILRTSASALRRIFNYFLTS